MDIIARQESKLCGTEGYHQGKTLLSQVEFEAVKDAFLRQVKREVVAGKIPRELVINFEQTGVNNVPGARRTQSENVSNCVEIAAHGDKCQITITWTLSGTLLHFQVLYEGKTEQCHPTSDFLQEFDVYHTPNHWANVETCIRFVTNAILPYAEATRKELGLGEEYVAIIISDSFRGHQEDDMKSLLLKNYSISFGS